MSIIDDLTKVKRRVGEALARIDAQREKLTSELAELEATERVLARYGKDTRAKKTSSATKAAAPARQQDRLRSPTVKSAGRMRTAPALGDQVLALATGKTRQEITIACKGARPNHVGVLIARHSALAASKSVTGSSTLHTTTSERSATA
jgi:hypothetical protein